MDYGRYPRVDRLSLGDGDDDVEETYGTKEWVPIFTYIFFTYLLAI